MSKRSALPDSAGDIWMKCSAIGMLIGLAVRFLVDGGMV